MPKRSEEAEKTAGPPTRATNPNKMSYFIRNFFFTPQVKEENNDQVRR